MFPFILGFILCSLAIAAIAGALITPARPRRHRAFGWALLIGLGCAALARPALAATSAATVTIDLTSLISGVLVPILTAVLLAILSWAAALIGAHFHVQISASNRQLVETAIQNGINFAQAKLAPNEKINAPAQIADVVNYILPKIPGALAWLKITPDSLAEQVTARLPQS